MTPLLRVRVFGFPVAQGRPRAFKLPDGQIRMHDPESSADWKRTIKGQVLAVPDRAAPSAAPLAMRLQFFLRRPDSLPKRVLLHTKKPDIDNLQKGVTDSLLGITYLDDSQIVAVTATKEYSPEPGVLIEVWEIAQGVATPVPVEAPLLAGLFEPEPARP